MAGLVGRRFGEYLAAGARAGDKRAFERLVEYWQPRLIAHAFRLTGDEEFARDVVQDVWIDIYRGLSSLRDTVVFPAWAYRIVTRRVADGIRKKQRKRRDDAVFLAEPEPTDTSSNQIEARADRGPLSRAIACLPVEQKAVIGLFYIEEFSVAEIALALKIPAGTVKTRLMHARNKLRAVLQGEEK